ncbi:serine protease inhibitor-like [Bombyx mandarina]|uniref:Serine protease inhibitor-like n=1 Tax=Bombyx mandarina TaxID=7092 RepID=A0A6J2KDE4_BOMMA|nr:serine protease inhibitor-like [Bombyx mandarina]
MWKIALTLAAVVTSAPLDNADYSSINTFALRLLDHTYAFQEAFGVKNIAISPLSIWSVFSLLAEGSSGDTFMELLNALQLPNDLAATQTLHLAARGIFKSTSRDLILKGQSVMLSDCSLEIHPEFCELANLYSTDIYTVDPRNTTKLAADINYWICLATEGRILNSVKPQDLENLRMVLVDALYFKANWKYPFDPTQTKEEAFYNSQGQVVGSVNMMYHKAPHNLADSPRIGAQVLEMTYGKDEEFSMLILVPFDGMPIKKLLNNLATQPMDWLEDFRLDDPPKVDCYVPRFKISSQSDMVTPLKYTGIHSIFDGQKAELPGVSTSPLFVSSAIQNVDLEVTEEGTVAAVATVVGLEDRILGPRIEVNKEFVFLIVDRRTNLIVFSGVYGDPTTV